MLIKITSAVPSGTPFNNSACMTGITPAWLAYNGAPMTETSGTAQGLSAPRYLLRIFTGTKPCMAAPTKSPKIMQTHRLLIVSHAKECA